MSSRIVMMATGEFALPTFRALLASSEHQVQMLVTQPDRRGAGRHRHVNRLKELAIEQGIPVFQPESVNTEESLAELRKFETDVYVVAAYGQILSADVIALPQRAAFNLHASILPKYRGAAPIQYAIWCGEQETGISIFQLVPRLDAGPILKIDRTMIGAKETSGELHDRLAEIAVGTTLSVLEQLEHGTIEPIEQDESLVCKAPRIRKEQGLIPWDEPANKVACHIRAMQPWPNPYTFLHQGEQVPTRLIILDVDPIPLADTGPELTEQLEDLRQKGQAKPGRILVTSQPRLLVLCGSELLQINVVQPAGKRSMNTEEFLRGREVRTGDRFGPEQDVHTQ